MVLVGRQKVRLTLIKLTAVSKLSMAESAPLRLIVSLVLLEFEERNLLAKGFTEREFFAQDHLFLSLSIRLLATSCHLPWLIFNKKKVDPVFFPGPCSDCS